MKRNWAAAHEKLADEGKCRYCQRIGPLDPAHIVPRSRVRPGAGEDPRNIVPLCRPHHLLYDGGSLDILPVLTREEQAYAVELVGLEEARRYLTNERAAA